MKIENKSGCEQQEKLCTAYLWGCKNCRYVTTDCYKLKDKKVMLNDKACASYKD